MRDFLFSYDDITLIPKKSSLRTRSEGDTSADFFLRKWKLPVIPANMEDVISIENAKWLAENGYFYIMHRFGDKSQWNVLDSFNMSISVGVKDEDKKYIEESVLTPFSITVDVAHAHHDNVKDMLKFLGKLFDHCCWNDRPYIIAGNVATADGYKFLCDLGVNMVKVGIGGGSICSTRYRTGFHIPTAYSVWDCAKAREEGRYDTPIIADGGAKHFGDVAKALVLGADMVMSGRWFAECIDSPAKIRGGKKVYRGSTSYEAKGHNNHIEGHTIEISEGCTYKERLIEIQQSLQSSISYAGGKDLSAFNTVEWRLCNR